ncbi:putative DNA-binding protein with PD1-like DNA-binding motif [Halanaeroarchaeum sp. HSR-CO]|uniref:PPC domain-containing DNA-binding protein n=1 Tax=Halanaeroarchaeum sp. HSR-CO TaxID=2866382 RepID=UPI00217EB8BF|nr:PPC domain-containing DNA-binding protein [Halanaeroarchaeum sp. HSR-CO]UWG48957.1 putative DNA-binding protein with PD1-like DNA-binding motif [Halanaeroarchaeum sp. HSR-CO]
MEYVEEPDRIVVRMDPGDHVMEELDTVREECDLTGGFFFGIGAIDEVTLGHYDVEAQDYKEETFEEDFEVTSFLGNVGPDKIHAHVQLGKRDFTTIGGHFAGGRVSGTFEVVVVPVESELTHQLDERTGLDVFDLE